MVKPADWRKSSEKQNRPKTETLHFSQMVKVIAKSWRGKKLKDHLDAHLAQKAAQGLSIPADPPIVVRYVPLSHEKGIF